MITMEKISQNGFISAFPKGSISQKGDFSELLGETAKTQKSNGKAATVRADIKELSEKYDVHNVDYSQSKELISELQQAGLLKSGNFSYGLIALPITKEEVLASANSTIDIPYGIEFPSVDATDMLNFSRQLAQSQMFLYQKLLRLGKEYPNIKADADKYRELANALQQLERK